MAAAKTEAAVRQGQIQRERSRRIANPLAGRMLGRPRTASDRGPGPRAPAKTISGPPRPSPNRESIVLGTWNVQPFAQGSQGCQVTPMGGAVGNICQLADFSKRQVAPDVRHDHFALVQRKFP